MSSRELGKVRERSTFKEQTVDALYKLTEKAKIFMNEKLKVRKSCAWAFENFESFESTRGNSKNASTSSV